MGLGNPGLKYNKTRHNIGFNILDRLAYKHDVKIGNVGFKGLYYKGKILDEKVILLKPQTYMNLSGESVSQVVNMYKIPIEDVYLIYDELDLPLGKIRIRQQGSAAGHNGVKSVIQHLGNKQNFPRLRVGIGNNKEQDTKARVLSKFSKEESKIIDKVIDECCEVLEDIIKYNDILRTMNEFNSHQIL